MTPEEAEDKAVEMEIDELRELKHETKNQARSECLDCHCGQDGASDAGINE